MDQFQQALNLFGENDADMSHSATYGAAQSGAQSGFQIDAEQACAPLIDLDALNPAQREAVECTQGPLLVLAGAGSGKTRVLTYRIAHMIADLGVKPWQILAITFTNKAAAEMRERLSRLIGGRSRGMWVSTFHSMCVRMLRADCERIGYRPGFTIYDADDQKRLVKTIIDELDINPKMYAPNTVLGRISAAKNELLGPEEFATRVNDPVGKVSARVYEVYQTRLRGANAMDFDDLLLNAYRLLRDHEQVLAAYQERFRYILVDEYQDTNHAQYEITRLLAEANKNIMVVGDDDQSIYSWRGADIRNILEFEHDYPNAHVVKLEQNYRSAGNILNAANAVIANNTHRKPKKLFTDAGAGDKIAVYVAADERDEGRWIASQIDKLHNGGVSYTQIALFYRTNAQSRVLEDMLLRAGVPYKIVGGTKFFDRKEIRDVMAYLTLAVNPADDMAFERIVNVPRRGIGSNSLGLIKARAGELGVPLTVAAEDMICDVTLRKQTRDALGKLVQLLKDARTYAGDLRKVVERIVSDSQMIEALSVEGTDEAAGRIENIREFFGVVGEFAQSHESDEAFFAAPTSESGDGAELAVSGMQAGQADETAVANGVAVSPSASENELSASEANSDEPGAPIREFRGDSLADFIEWVRLRTDLDSASEGGETITLMTVHSAKGLEFDYVFVAGLEEGIFPHMAHLSGDGDVEEERRLAYVAITRARRKLTLTCAQSRQLFGQTNCNPTSRFLREIPQDLRETSGLGSVGFEGTGWEKRGSRRGIAGSGVEAGGGRVFGQSSAGGAGGRRSGSRGSGSAGRVSASNHRVGAGAGIGKREGANETFAVGDMLDHKTFGRGRVLSVSGDTVVVKFTKTGQTKKLLKDYAPIVKIK
jgi:DNA helicase-2/ATP-dependent DNA helicase PcrA